MRTLIALLLTSLLGAPLLAHDREAERLQKAAAVIDEAMGMPEKGIPRELLNKAVCVGIIPSYKKGAFGVGVSGGKGALICRRGGNGPWGPPSMFTTGGLSIGLQLGGQATDFVFLVMNESGARKLLRSSTKLGADASVAGGPVGRTSEAATDATLHAEVLTYSRSRGAFAGLSLDGAVLKQDHDGNARLYGHKVDPKDILFTGNLGVPAGAKPLVAALQKYSSSGGQPFREK